MTAAVRAETKQSLSLFKFKLAEGMVSASHTSRIKRSVEEQLQGFDKRTCYLKYKDGIEILTEKEKHYALLYMYENDLMTPEQEQQFEAEHMT